MTTTYYHKGKKVSRETFRSTAEGRKVSDISDRSSRSRSSSSSSSSSSNNNQNEIASSFYGKSYAELNSAQQQQVRASLTQAEQRLKLQGKSYSQSNIITSVQERMSQEAQKRTAEETAKKIQTQQAEQQEITKTLKAKEQLSQFQKAQVPAEPTRTPIPPQFLENNAKVTKLDYEFDKDFVTITNKEGKSLQYDRPSYDKWIEGNKAYDDYLKKLEKQEKAREEQKKNAKLDKIKEGMFTPAILQANKLAENQIQYDKAKAELNASVFTQEQKDAITFKQDTPTPNFLTDTTTSTRKQTKDVFVDLSVNKEKLKLAKDTKITRDTVDFVNKNLDESNIFINRFQQIDTTTEQFRSSPMIMPKAYVNERLFQETTTNLQDFWGKEALKGAGKVLLTAGFMAGGSALVGKGLQLTGQLLPKAVPLVTKSVQVGSKGLQYVYGASVGARAIKIATGKTISIMENNKLTMPKIINAYEGKSTKRLLEGLDLGLEVGTVAGMSKLIKLKQVDSNTYRLDTDKLGTRTQTGDKITFKEYGKIDTLGNEKYLNIKPTTRDVVTTLEYSPKGSSKYTIKILGTNGKVLSSTSGPVQKLGQRFFTIDGKEIFTGMTATGKPYVAKTELNFKGPTGQTFSESESLIKPTSTTRNLFQSITTTKVTTVTPKVTEIKTTSDVKAQESFSYMLKNAKITKLATSNQYQLQVPKTEVVKPVTSGRSILNPLTWNKAGTLALNIGTGTGGTGFQPITNIKPVTNLKPIGTIKTNINVDGLGQTALPLIFQPVTAPIPLFNIRGTTQPISNPVFKPVTQLKFKPLTQPVTEPTIEPLTQPVTQPLTQPITEPVNTGNTQPVTQPVTEPMTEPLTQPITEPLVTPVITPIVALPVQVKPIVTPIIPIFTFPTLPDLDFNKKTKPQNLYDVEIRKGGVWGKATTKRLTQQQALDFGTFAVDRTPQASFRITQRSIRQSLGMFSNIDIKATKGEFKKKRSQFYKKKNVFIESSKFRISTAGEKIGLKKAKLEKKRFKLW